MTSAYPSRIVCLTEETTETLYLLGEGDRVVGVSGYTVRPPEARKKPRVSAFINARFDKIEALSPESRPRVLRSAGRHRRPSSSDAAIRSYLQSAVGRRDLPDDLMVGGMVGRSDKRRPLADLQRGLDEIRARGARLPRRPRVYSRSGTIR